MLLTESNNDFKKYYDEIVVDDFMRLADLKTELPYKAEILVKDGVPVRVVGANRAGMLSDGIPVFMAFFASKDNNSFGLLSSAMRLINAEPKPYVICTYISHDNEYYESSLALAQRLGLDIVENNEEAGITILYKVEGEKEDFS